MSDLPLIFVGNVRIVMIWKIRNIETMYYVVYTNYNRWGMCFNNYLGITFILDMIYELAKIIPLLMLPA